MIADDDLEEDEDYDRPTPVAYDGAVHVLEDQCGDCIFRPGNLMNLADGALKSLVDECLEVGGHVTCHDTLRYGKYSDDPRVRGAVCRGFFDRYLDRTPHLTIAQRLGLIKEVPRPEDLPKESK